MNNLTNGEAAAAGMVVGGTLTFAIIFLYTYRNCWLENS